jgi:hypothetical protein
MIKSFKDWELKEGAGFGSSDYRNVTGNATSSGYLNDKQPLGNSNGATIASDLPRGNWHEPSTVIIGFKDYLFKDPYFLKRKHKKRKKKKKIDIKHEDIIKFNNQFKKETDYFINNA